MKRVMVKSLRELEVPLCTAPSSPVIRTPCGNPARYISRSGAAQWEYLCNYHYTVYMSLSGQKNYRRISGGAAA